MIAFRTVAEALDAHDVYARHGGRKGFVQWMAYHGHSADGYTYGVK